MNVKSKLLSLQWKSYQGVDYIVFDLQPHHKDLLNSFFDVDTKKWRNKQIQVSLPANSNWHKDIFQFENWGMSAFINVELNIHPSLFGLFMLHSPKQEASWYASSIFARMVSANKEFDKVPKASVSGTGLPEPKKKTKKLKPKNTMIQDVRADMDVVKFRKGNQQTELFNKNIEAQFPPEEEVVELEEDQGVIIKFIKNLYAFLDQIPVDSSIKRKTVYFLRKLKDMGLIKDPYRRNNKYAGKIGEVPSDVLVDKGCDHYIKGSWINISITEKAVPIIMEALRQSGCLFQGYSSIGVGNNDGVLIYSVRK